MPHVKPSIEELDEEAERLQQELEADDSSDEEPEEGNDTEENEDTDNEGPDESGGDDSDDDGGDTRPPENNQPDYREKFTESSREAQVLHSKNKRLTQAIDSASELAEVSEEDLRAKYSDWDSMTEFEQGLARDNMINSKRFEIISSTTKEFKDLDQWVERVDEFVANPETVSKYSQLDGNEEEFKKFAIKKSRRGADLGDLVSAFLYNRPDIKKKNRGTMLETGASGAGKKPKVKKISIEQAAKLRATNYTEYAQLLREGKISDLIE